MDIEINPKWVREKPKKTSVKKRTKKFINDLIYSVIGKTKGFLKRRGYIRYQAQDIRALDDWYKAERAKMQENYQPGTHVLGERTILYLSVLFNIGMTGLIMFITVALWNHKWLKIISYGLLAYIITYYIKWLRKVIAAKYIEDIDKL